MHFFGDTSFEHAKPVTRIAPGTAACGGLAQSSMCSWIPKIAGRPGGILQLRCVGAPWQPMKIAADRRSQVKFSNLFPFLLLDVKDNSPSHLLRAKQRTALISSYLLVSKNE